MIAEREVAHRWALPARLRGVVITGRTLVDAHPHSLPLTVLWALTVVVMRRWLFTGGLPAGSDSAFLYSSVPYFSSHDLHAFSVWLPSPLGQVQQYSVYWFLGMWSALVHDPIVLYKGASLLVALLTSTGMYGLAYWLIGSRRSATVAAALYAFSPFVVSHWIAGHLNIEISLAVGPIAVWALLLALRTGAVGAMIGLGLAGSALYLLTTAQGIYWILPMAVVVAFESAATWVTVRRVRPVLVRLASVAAVAGAVFAVASAVELLPLWRGAAAPFVTGAQRYYIEGLDIHAKYSLPFILGVAGVPREHWLDPSVHLAAGGFDSLWFRAASLFIVASALSFVWTRHRRLALELVGPTVLAWVLAAGPSGAFGPVYRLLYDHVPYFRLIRVPNRWLMVSVFAVALLAGASVHAAQGFVEARAARTRRDEPVRTGGASRLRWRVAALLVCGGLVSTYSFAHGLPTWDPPHGYAAAYSTLATDREDWRILTTPFFQSWMATGRSVGDDVSLAPDLGYTSSVWHRHATLGRGGWDPRASRLVNYVYELTKQGANRSVSKLLGAMGVKYIALDPHASLEVIQGQNRFFARQDGLRRVAEAGGVEIYENTHYLPQAFVTRRWCVVAGGLGVLGDLAEHESFHFGQIGLEFADQLHATHGVEGLRAALSASHCLITAPGGLADLRVMLGASSFHVLDDVAPSEWTREDVPASLDLRADVSTIVRVPAEHGLTGSFSVEHEGMYALWVSGPRDADQGALDVRIDGDRLPGASLSARLAEGVVWARTEPVRLDAGNHVFAVSNAGPEGAGDVRLVDVAVMSNSAAAWAPDGMPGMDVIRETTWDAAGEALDRAAPLVARWRKGYGVKADDVRSLGATLSVSDAGSSRPYFTIGRSRVERQVVPDRPFGITFTGTGSQQLFYLNFIFDTAGYQRASFRFRDTTSEPRNLLFSPLRPSAVTSVPDWSHVREITLSSNSKNGWAGRVAVEGPYLTRSVGTPPAGWHPTFVQDGRDGDPFVVGARAVGALSPADQSIADHATLGGGLGQGLLIFTQAYHEDWRLDTERDVEPSVALGFANAYELDGHSSPGTISFTLAAYGKVGTVVSLVGWMSALALLVVLRARRRRSPHGAT